MQIGGKILQRIPFFGQVDGRGYAFEAGEFRVLDDEVGGLQPGSAAVGDELAAQHSQIRIGLLAVGNVTIGPVSRGSGSV